MSKTVARCAFHVPKAQNKVRHSFAQALQAKEDSLDRFFQATAGMSGAQPKTIISQRKRAMYTAVSYTHLTLPTILRV